MNQKKNIVTRKNDETVFIWMNRPTRQQALEDRLPPGMLTRPLETLFRGHQLPRLRVEQLPVHGPGKRGGGDDRRDKILLAGLSQELHRAGTLAQAPLQKPGKLMSGFAKVVIDGQSLLYLIGMTLDYEGGLNGKGFIFSNPNANKTCGCGSSFGV